MTTPTTDANPPPDPWSGTHTPVWPEKRGMAMSTQPVERVLAYRDADGRIVAEDGRSWMPETWEACATLLHEEDIQLYTGPLHDALADWWDCLTSELEPEKATKAQAKALQARGRYVVAHYSENAGNIVSFTIYLYRRDRRGRMRWIGRNIVQASAWGGRTVGPDFLRDLRTLFTLVGHGVATTPGDLGAKVMHRLWQEHDGEWVRHHRPTSACVQTLFDHAIGAIKETFQPDQVFDQAFEVDRRNGYAAECRRLPAGTVRGPLKKTSARRLMTHLRPADHLESTTWFGRCVVQILAPGIAPGDVAPFAVRMIDGQGPGTYGTRNRIGPGATLYTPTEPGVYLTWLWKEEAEAIQRRYADGDPIRVIDVDYAWYWVKWTEQLADWSERMDALRSQAEREQGKQLADLVKVAMVAAIGRLGMTPRKITVSTEGGAEKAELPGASFDAVPLYVSSEPCDIPTMKHWHAYILARQNLSILEQAHREYKENNNPAFAINVDGAFYAHPPLPETATTPAAAQLGEYKVRELREYVAFPLAGYVLKREQDGGSKMPGIDGIERKLLLHGFDPRAGKSKKDAHLRDTFRRSMAAAAGAELVNLERTRQWLLSKREDWEAAEPTSHKGPLGRLEERLRTQRRQE